MTGNRRDKGVSDYILDGSEKFKTFRKNVYSTIQKAREPKPSKTAQPVHQKPPAAPAENKQSRFAKKLQLDQRLSRVTGGTGGLVMLLDMMRQDAGRKDAGSFCFHAGIFMQRSKRLGPLLQEYKQLGVKKSDVKPYQELYDLREKIQNELTPSEEMTGEVFDGWQETIEQWFKLYNEDGE